MKIALIAAGVIIGLFLVDRLFLFLESKGYIYWRKVKPRGGTQSSTIQMMDEIFHPASKHVYEERQKQQSIAIDKKQKASKPGDD